MKQDHNQEFQIREEYLSFENALDYFFSSDKHEHNTYLCEMNNEMIFEIKFTNS